jgi:nucleoside-diphosphate-sugar epimerase
MAKYSKIAITGATGYIGKNLSHYLHKKGYEVYALIRPDKINAFNNGVSEKIYDLTDRDTLENIFKDVDAVIHLAALFNHPQFGWEDYYNVNVRGTENVLAAALKCNVKKVIHCSTVGVVSGNGNKRSNEESPYSPPEWDKYEVTKCEAEKLVIDFSKKNNLNSMVIRPSQVYGPGDKRKSKFYRMIKNGYIVNPGNTVKHPIYIEELCRAFEIALNTDTAPGEVFIIADQEEIMLKDLVNVIAKKMGRKYPRFIIPAAPVTLACTYTEAVCNSLKIKPPLFRRSMDFFTKSVKFDVNKAAKVLKFKSKVHISDGVDKTINWYIKSGLLNFSISLICF